MRPANHSDALRAEDLVEGLAELCVAIVDEEPERLLVVELKTRLRACCATQRPSGFELQATSSIRRSRAR
jgi:hypothetical protein